MTHGDLKFPRIHKDRYYHKGQIYIFILFTFRILNCHLLNKSLLSIYSTQGILLDIGETKMERT